MLFGTSKFSLHVECIFFLITALNLKSIICATADDYCIIVLNLSIMVFAGGQISINVGVLRKIAKASFRKFGISLDCRARYKESTKSARSTEEYSFIEKKRLFC